MRFEESKSKNPYWRPSKSIMRLWIMVSCNNDGIVSWNRMRTMWMSIGVGIVAFKLKKMEKVFWTVVSIVSCRQKYGVNGNDSQWVTCRRIKRTRYRWWRIMGLECYHVLSAHGRSCDASACAHHIAAQFEEILKGGALIDPHPPKIFFGKDQLPMPPNLTILRQLLVLNALEMKLKS